MSKGIPPVPPAGRSDKGPSAAPELDEHAPEHGAGDRRVTGNVDEKGRTGNIKQNTTHQGYTQDR